MKFTKRQIRAKRRAKSNRLQRWQKVPTKRSKYVAEDVR
jgi:hypothetical protein